VREALAAGYAPPSATQQEEVRKREEYGTGLGTEVRAGLEGAARGLTFGLSDVAARALGADAEGLAERKARNPYAATGGELAGVGAGFLAPVGLFGAGVRGAAAAGELATQAAGRGLAALGAEETPGWRRVPSPRGRSTLRGARSRVRSTAPAKASQRRPWATPRTRPRRFSPMRRPGRC
jgi:hypothetical protein